METLVANLTGNIRRAQHQGREYIVAPLSLIVPGVLNGSEGPLFYAAEEIARSASAWNGMPIVLDHPMQNGKPVSARSPDILNKFGLGFLADVKFSDKLIGEGWFDVEATRKVDNRILQALESGKQIELSTGLNLDAVKDRGTHNGREYIAKAHNYRPDHLAVFHDKIGACSLNDGCGVNVNEEKEPQGIFGMMQRIWNKLNTKPSTEEPSMSSKFDKKVTVDSIIANCDCWTEQDRETLNGFSDDKLTKLNETITKGKEQATVANAFAKGIELDGGLVLVANKEGKPVVRGKDGKEEVVNASSLGKVASRKLLNEMSDDELDEEMKKRMAAKKPTANTDTKDQTVNTPKPIELKDLPADMQEDLTFARNAKQQRKDQLLDRLTANIEDKEQRKVHRERLNKRTLNELEQDASLLPAEEPVANADDDRPSYYGASVPIRNNQNDKSQKPTPLGLPVWNFDSEPEARKQPA